MKAPHRIVVIGGTGLIGSKTAELLRASGHEVVVAAPSTGVNTLTGEGLAQALTGATAVIDVSNAPAWDAEAVMNFFTTSTSNLLKAETTAGVTHHIALSIVGTDRMPDNSYFAAKVAQEMLIKNGDVPYTIVRATQFFEFLTSIADSTMVDGTVHLAGGSFQPIAADDVASVLAEVAASTVTNEIIEIAGPDSAPFDEFMRRHFALSGDTRSVVRDADALYYGGRVEARSLVPGKDARLGLISLEDWTQRRRIQ